MIGVIVWCVYLAPQNIPRVIVLTLGNKVVSTNMRHHVFRRFSSESTTVWLCCKKKKKNALACEENTVARLRDFRAEVLIVTFSLVEARG